MDLLRRSTGSNPPIYAGDEGKLPCTSNRRSNSMRVQSFDLGTEPPQKMKLANNQAGYLKAIHRSARNERDCYWKLPKTSSQTSMYFIGELWQNTVHLVEHMPHCRRMPFSLQLVRSALGWTILTSVATYVSGRSDIRVNLFIFTCPSSFAFLRRLYFWLCICLWFCK